MGRDMVCSVGSGRTASASLVRSLREEEGSNLSVCSAFPEPRAAPVRKRGPPSSGPAGDTGSDKTKTGYGPLFTLGARCGREPIPVAGHPSSPPLFFFSSLSCLSFFPFFSPSFCIRIQLTPGTGGQSGQTQPPLRLSGFRLRASLSQPRRPQSAVPPQVVPWFSRVRATDDCRRETFSLRRQRRAGQGRAGQGPSPGALR